MSNIKNNNTNSSINSLKTKPLLSVDNLNLLFKVRGLFFKAINDISFTVNQGDFFGIIGESGSGKTSTGKCIIKLYQPTGGKIEIDDHIVSNKRLRHKTKKWLNKNVQMIFQDPMSSLNPTKNVLKIISEPILINKSIYKKTLVRWYELNRSSRYLLVEAINFKNKLEYEFKNNFLTLLNKNLKKAIELFTKTNYQKLDFNSCREKFIFNMDSFVELINETINLISIFTNEFNQNIKLLIKNFYDGNYATVFQDYEKLLVENKNAKKIYQFSENGLNQKDEIKTLKQNLKTHTKEYKHIYLQRTKNYINSWKTTYIGNIKTFKQNFHFAQQQITYTLNYLNYLSVATQLFYLKKIKKIRILQLSNINYLVKFIESKINKLFWPIKNKVYEINQQFEDANLQSKKENINDLTILIGFGKFLYSNQKQNKWNNYDYNKQQFNKLMFDKPAFLFKNEGFDGFYQFQNEISSAIKNEIEKIEKVKENIVSDFKTNNTNLKKEIDQKEEKLKNTLTLYKSSGALNTNKNKWDITKQNLTKAKKAKDDYIVKVNKGIELKKQKEFIKQNEPKIKLLLKEFKNAKNQLYSLIKNQLKEVKSSIKNEIKKQKQINLKSKNKKNNWSQTYNSWNFYHKLFKTFKNEVKIRWKSLAALMFEYKNALDEVDTNEFIFEKKYLYNWIKIPKLFVVLKRNAVYEALENVGLKREHAYRYPHEFSGGQRQRIVIARALINNPKVIIADEPISALDVSIQAQIINILQDLVKKHNVTVILIAHDLSMVNYACNNVIIMHRGRILEKGAVKNIFNNPIHPYTKSLMKATPKLSRVHVDLASFSEDFTYDKDWNDFNKPQFFKINNDLSHQVYGTKDQLLKWVKEKYNEDE